MGPACLHVRPHDVRQGTAAVVKGIENVVVLFLVAQHQDHGR